MRGQTFSHPPSYHKIEKSINIAKPISAMEAFKIYIVEDSPWDGELAKYHLSLNPDYEIKLFTTARACLDELYKKPNIVCMDYGLPDMRGDKLLERIKNYDANIPVIIISAQEDISVAVNLLKMGATDYIVKNDNLKEMLWNSVLRIRENQKLREEVAVLKEQLEQKYSFSKTIIGQSEPMKNVFKLIEKAVKSNINVSISSETGTGKEVVAKAIHYSSDRQKKPFVAINMAAIPKELIESELFGHEKGSFTGAVSRKIGKFEEAQGGTIFLDEIAELDLNMQSKILRVLQEREVIRVGGNEKVKLDVRLITATHKNLIEEVRNNNFRQDLYYRIIGLPIELPPLRDRGNDILVLARHFADAFTQENQQPKVVFDEDAQKKLLQHSYPGNVRELKSIVELACVMCSSTVITAQDIVFTTMRFEDNFIATEKSLHEYNCDIIQYFLRKYNNNVLVVAKKLDIGKSTIYKLLQESKISK